MEGGFSSIFSMKTDQIVLLVLFLLFVSCSLDMNENSHVDVHQPVSSSSSKSVIIKLDERLLSQVEEDLMAKRSITKSSELNQTKESLGIISLQRMFPYSSKYEERTRAEGLHRWYVVQFENEQPYTKSFSELVDLDGVECVEPVRKVISTTYFSDPFAKYQWHYQNDGSLSSRHVTGADVVVEDVWKKYTVGNKDVIVAVVDGGIDLQHEDLSWNYLTGYNFVNDSPIITPHDHGTHVAGTIGAVNNNGIGVSGIAGGDYEKGIRGVSLLSCQIFQDTGGTDDESADGAVAIKWAADNGAVIAQNSWGYVYDSYRDAKSSSIPQYLKDAVDYFIKYAGIDENGNQVGPMKGGVVLFASGNSGWDTDPIGLYDPIISVGALGPDKQRTKYSNYGSWVDISAPGGESTIDNGEVYSTIPGNRYGYMHGTSMACPHVSGVAALIISFYGGQGFTPEKLKDRLLQGANYNVEDVSEVGPAVDALGSIVYGNKISPEKVTDLSAEYVSGKVVVKWSVTTDADEGKALGYKVFASNSKIEINDLNYSNPSRNVLCADILTTGKSVGSVMSSEFSDCKRGSTYYIVVIGYDKGGNYSEMSDIVTCRVPENNPPVILPKQDMSSFQVGSNDVVKLNFTINDPDNHDCFVSLKNAIDVVSLSSNSSDEYTVTIKGNGNMPGRYQVQLVARDIYDAYTEQSIDFELLENHAPINIVSPGNIIMTGIGDSYHLDMDSFFRDPDGSDLIYEVYVSDPSVIYFTSNDEDLQLVTLNYGISEVYITACDSYGQFAKIQFTVSVKNSDTINLYPNPVKDFMSISVPCEMSVNIKIVSQDGEVLYISPMELSPFKNVKIDMRGVLAGLYVVSIRGEGVVYDKMMMKE